MVLHSDLLRDDPLSAQRNRCEIPLHKEAPSGLESIQLSPHSHHWTNSQSRLI
jgi:hypothetical protein